MYEDLPAIEEGLAAVVADLDPTVLHGADALVALERVCRIMKLATTAAMLLGRRVHDTDAWKPSGCASAAHLLARLAGLTLGDATSLLGTAKKLADLPKTDDAARQGKLSAKQAAEVAKGATADPTAEDDLLGLADHASTAELTNESRRRRFAAAGDDQRRHARMKAKRALHRFSDDDGSAVMRWRHLPEAGAELDAILSDYVDDEFRTARSENRREQRCAYAADALLAAMRDAAAFRRGESIDDDDDVDGDVADRDAEDDAVHAAAVDGDVDDEGAHVDGPDGAAAAVDDEVATTVETGDPVDPAQPAPVGGSDRPDPVDRVDRAGSVAADAPGRPNRRTRRRAGERSAKRRPRRRRGADAKVIVRIDHAALIRGHTEPGEICEIAGVGPVPVTSVVELMDDAFLAAVITKGHDVCTVAHLGRQPNAYQQTALQARGICCAVLGCPNIYRLERDHREDWARTKHTRLDELDWLCSHHHDLKTRFGYGLAPGNGPRAFLSPEQRRAAANRPATPRPPTRPATTPDPRSAPRGSNRRRRGRADLPPEALTLDL